MQTLSADATPVASVSKKSKKKCKKGYKTKKVKGKVRCVKKNSDALTPSSIKLYVGQLRGDLLRANGTACLDTFKSGSRRGEWLLTSEARTKHYPFLLSKIVDMNLVNFAEVMYDAKILGRPVTAKLTINKVSSNIITLLG